MPHTFIDIMARLTKPQSGELCNNPACDTFDFMIAAFDYVREHTDKSFDLNQDEAYFEVQKVFTGVGFVHDTHRLVLMNAVLHNTGTLTTLGDTLSSLGKHLKNPDVVLTSPPFDTKRGGGRVTRDDFTFPASNK